MDKIGIVQGKFQILHLKHMEYILAGKMRCEKLYIGIMNPDDLYLSHLTAKEKKHFKEKNPLTYLERYEMIEKSLTDFGIARTDFEIVPFPINRPDYITQYTPKEGIYYVGICGQKDRDTMQILQNQGLTVETLWEKEMGEDEITSAGVREDIRFNEDWTKKVPKAVCDYIVEHKIDRRI